MTNSESLDRVGDAIRSAERELSRLDALAEVAATSQRTIEKLTADIADLHANVSDLAPKQRSAALTNVTALLALERADLATIQGKITAQRSKVLAAGNDAATQMQAVRDRLFLKRRENAETWIRTEFNTSRIPCSIASLVDNRKSIRQIKELKAANDLFTIGIVADAKIRALRELGTHFEEVRGLAENEVGLILDPQPAVTEPVVELEPTLA